MPIIKTRDLSGAQLDWAVATAEGETAVIYQGACQVRTRTWKQFAPDLDLGVHEQYDTRSYHRPENAYPIIHRECINVGNYMIIQDPDHRWHAHVWTTGGAMDHRTRMEGPDGITAALRCFVATKLGQTVNVPDPLQ